ncbi:arginine--tRNA ligase [bacterium]|nr:arginine--tRNA ligase [bacterium]
MYLKNRVHTLMKEEIAVLESEGFLPQESTRALEIERPAQTTHGDFSTNLAMKLAKSVRKPPRVIAEALVGKLSAHQDFFAEVTIAGPGFVNFRLHPECLLEEAHAIRERGQAYGTSDLGKGRKLLLEFVSANPTGPLNIVSARAAAVGDALAAILISQGVVTSKEYYVNDAGRQARLLGHSMYARWKQAQGENYPVPEGGYEKDYVGEVARASAEIQAAAFVKADEASAIELHRSFGVREMVGRHQQSLRDYGVTFDTWYSEKKLHDSGMVETAIVELKERGFVYEKEGALWFASTKFGDDKDRVLKKADGDWAYIAADIAYHRDKFERGFTELMDLWGPDHHGYIARMQAAMQALGHDADAFRVRIVQQVNLLEGGKAVSMSKRGEGRLLEMDDLIKDVGRDVARFFFLMRSTDAHLDFDLDLARKHSDDNPVYYVQYAYARICSILKKAETEGLPVPAADEKILKNYSAQEAELDLIRVLSTYPEILETCFRNLEPHGLTFYLRDLATAFHRFYTFCRVVDLENREQSTRRLVMVDAARIIFKNGLALLGVSAPESM